MFFVRTDTKVFEALFTQSVDPIAITAAHGGAVQLNPAWHDVLGWTLEELTSASLLHFVHFNDIPSMLESRARLDLPGTHSIHGELRFLHRNGEWRTLEYNATSFEGNHFTIYHDVSARIQSELMALNALDSTIAALDAAVDPIIVFDRQSQVVQANRAAKQLLGVHESEFLDRTSLSLVDELDRDDVLSVIRNTFDEQGSTSVTFRIRRVNDELVTIEARGRAVPDRDGPTNRCVFVLRDVTQARETNEALERASSLKSEFIAGLSHEMRTPLNAVLGFAQILQLESDSPKDVELANHIRLSSLHLLELTDDAEAFTRDEADDFSCPIAPLTLKNVVRECVENVTPLAKAQRIELMLRHTPNVEVLANGRRVKQVLINLLSNAIKYNRKNGVVIVGSNVRGGRLRVAVSDTGPGLDAEHVDRLFTPYDRLDVDDPEVEGTGLGLALSKRFVEAMGGAIGVESAPGDGSTFWVEFPLAS